MLNHETCACYHQILHSELLVAMGCTEPIAIAYAGALAVQLLGCEPTEVKLACSGNIIKNVKGVTVPNSGGLRGIEIAALLGMVSGNAHKKLAVLENIDAAKQARAKTLLEQGICHTSLIEDTDNLAIVCTVIAGNDTATVEIRNTHTNVIHMEKNGQEIALAAQAEKKVCTAPDKSLLNVRDILQYAETADLSPVADLLRHQISCNCAISQAGLHSSYGTEVGRTLQEIYGSDHITLKAAAAAAAGSGARMNGCALPVVINSGSGNQGLTITLPIVVYAEELGISEDRLLRALAVANLLSVHQKKYIGSLSAYCGATSAACAAACAICWMQGGTYEQICGTITNSLGTLGGMLCDGAKSSCASKIATAVYSSLLSMRMAMANRCFSPGEGLITADIETTISNIGAVAKLGMHPADVQILQLMLTT